ncbi:MAG: hypothetical protein B6I19_09755 [Bacteroidetes bacterium 4572_114]|nr:MAG: hypothetical protein B6I19_09755 [Bacteroidetes bacterium 4572_114]
MKKFNFSLLLIIVLLAFACEKGPDEIIENTDYITIDSLTATFYTVKAWDTTTITCYARGENLVYGWECDHGNFNGSGNQIKYAAGQCCIGLNTITCTVSNDSSQVSRDIQIEVTTYFDWK